MREVRQVNSQLSLLFRVDVEISGLAFQLISRMSLFHKLNSFTLAQPAICTAQDTLVNLDQLSWCESFTVQ